MVWASLDGIRLPLLRGSWVRTDNPLGVDAVAISGARAQTRFAEGEVYRGKTKGLTLEQRESYKGLLKGWGETWLFNSTVNRSLSSKGTGTTTAATTSGTGGKFTGTGLLTVGSGSTITFATTYAKRFWVTVWRTETAAVDSAGITVGADGWHQYDFMGYLQAGTVDASGDLWSFNQVDANRGAVTLERCRVWRDGIAGTFKAGHWFAFNGASGFVLSGKSSNNVNASKDYSHVVARPYHGQADWPLARSTRLIADAGLERAWLEGDDMPSGDGRKVVCNAVDIETIDGVVGGAMHGRRLSFDLRDAVDASP